jgi:hypothetical protein
LSLPLQLGFPGERLRTDFFYHGDPGGDVDGVYVVAEDERVVRLSAARRRRDLLDVLRHLGQTLRRKFFKVLDGLDGHSTEHLE